MRFKFVIGLLIYNCAVFAQSLTPEVVNASGGSGNVTVTSGTAQVFYNIGETFYQDVQSSGNSVRLTQGFLQPSLVGSGVLNLQAYTVGMTCKNSNDAAILLNATGVNQPVTYKWFKNGTLLSDTSNSLLNLAMGTYSYVASDSKGNFKSGVIQINSSDATCDLIVYSGLTPNNDGHNDALFIKGVENFPDNKITIYNRWGDQVWQGTNYDNYKVAWTGKHENGSWLPPGTYFYLFETSSRKLNGWIQLMR